MREDISSDALRTLPRRRQADDPPAARQGGHRSRSGADGRIEGHDAAFLPGGHGRMEDLAHSEVLGRVVGTMYGRGRLIIADCHGPVGI